MGEVADATAWFMAQLLRLEPGTQNGGIFAPKPGYHNTRNNLLAKPEWRDDYSIQLPADKRGPGDKSAGADWTFPDAQAGDYTRILVYGRRIKAAFLARDWRLLGWREVLIQADPDTQAEGFDFVTWSTRTPDPTHLWHGHFSELRQYVEDHWNKRAMLSVLAGQTLAEWQTQEGGMKAYRIKSADVKYDGYACLSDGIHRRPLRKPGAVRTPALDGVHTVTLDDADRLAFGAEKTWDDYLDAVAGPIFPLGGTPETAAILAGTRVIVDEELDEQSRAGADVD